MVFLILFFFSKNVFLILQFCTYDVQMIFVVFIIPKGIHTYNNFIMFLIHFSMFLWDIFLYSNFIINLLSSWDFFIYSNPLSKHHMSLSFGIYLWSHQYISQGLYFSLFHLYYCHVNTSQDLKTSSWWWCIFISSKKWWYV